MKPDYQRAEQKAKELREDGADCPLQILKKLTNVAATSFADASARYGISREQLLSMFDSGNQDAITIFRSGSYLVIYNQELPCKTIRHAVARELGHIVMEHDGSRPEDVRMEEAECFARAFLCETEVNQDAARKKTASETA